MRPALWRSELADVVACSTPVGFFFQSRAPPGSTLTFPEGNLRDLWQHFWLHLPPLPFFSPSSPRPTLEGQEFLCSSDPAAVADCSQVTSVTFALLFPLPLRSWSSVVDDFLLHSSAPWPSHTFPQNVVHNAEPAGQPGSICCHPRCHHLRRARSLCHQGFCRSDRAWVDSPRCKEL